MTTFDTPRTAAELARELVDIRSDIVALTRLIACGSMPESAAAHRDALALMIADADLLVEDLIAAAL
jgi:hypothetical protein